MADSTADGLILLHKQPGYTSFETLHDIKRILGTGKVGHTGTLDKFAEGLLLILTRKALKLSQWFTQCDKQYEGTICFGMETDTLDPEGSPAANAPLPSREAVELALPRFCGNIEQTPPVYSAIHVNGKRASAQARQGIIPEMQKRPVTIYRLELRSWEPPFATIFVHCSSGTYIRSLARDIALAAGSRAHLAALIRTQVAGFKLEETGNRTTQSGISPQPIDKSVFERLGIPWFELDSQEAKKMVQGKSLTHILGTGVLPMQAGNYAAAAAFCGNELIAILEKSGGTWHYGYVYARN